MASGGGAADHVINDTKAFTAAISQTAELADQDKLATFGIVPIVQETRYCNIKRGAAVFDAYVVAQFVENLNLATAQQYLQNGDY
ncbi:sugar phosphate nucleotidyltransferase [Marinomonas shanghaiensis]|uniref:sugar phosphate nucleotidyltransferase n=1 Tax=Marinomonas shanghaiensis TaxID=2202418 RepID=UPI003A950A13